MTDISTLIDPSCGLKIYDRVVPIKPLNAGETLENYNKSNKEQSKQRSELIRCSYLSATIAISIIFIIIMIILLMSNLTATTKIMITIGTLLIGGFLVYISGVLAGRKYDVEQVVFNDIYKDTNWNIQEATRLYNQRKEAELERESKMAAARMQANAFKTR